MSKSLEALENIAITFDEMGFIATTLSPYRNKHFIEWFKNEYDIIKKDLERLEEIENLRTTPNALETCLANYMNKCIELEKENQELKNIVEADIKDLQELRKENQELTKEKNATIILMQLMALDPNNIVESALILDKYKKAIEILKDKSFVLDFGLSVFKWYELEQNYIYEYEYTEYFGEDLEYRATEYILTKEEYDLLKEVLEDER